MRASDFDKTLNEAMPMGGLTKFGQTIRSKLPGTLGAAQASGKLQAGQVANDLAKGYYQFLGQLGEQPTPRNLLQYLTKSGYPTKMAIADLKKNVKAPAPGTSLAEKAPVTPGNLSLVPKDLELEPQEPSTPRRDVTDVSASKPAPVTTKPTTAKPTKPGSIAMVPINQKQVFSALTAAARETFAGSTSTAATPQQTPQVPEPSVKSTQQAPSTGPSLAKSFASGFTGKPMPSGGGRTAPQQINFQDPRSLNNLISQIQGFAKAGGKLNPETKAALQKIINTL
jgi:hypothetical protein